MTRLTLQLILNRLILSFMALLLLIPYWIYLQVRRRFNRFKPPAPNPFVYTMQ